MQPSERRHRARLAAAISGNLLSDCTRGAITPAATLAATACLMLACASPAVAATYVVDTTGDPGPGGTTSLRQAIFQANASPNNLVQFAPSLNGSTITLQNGELPITESTYISGPGADKITISGNNASRIFHIYTSAASPLAVTLAGMTLTQGNSSGGGGAIYTKNISLTLRDAVITGNTAGGGGGIFALSDATHASSSVLTNVTIQNNTAAGAGGIYVTGGAGFTATHMAIAANNSGGCCGGGLFFNAGQVTLADTQIAGNTATSSGGGLAIEFSHLTVTDSTISGNASSGGDGGGIFVYLSYAGLTASRITGNSANNGGGIVVNDSGLRVSELNLFKSTVSGNKANAVNAFGGGIDIRSAAYLSMGRTLVSGNSAYDYSGGGGGGIALQYTYSQNFITESTIYGNYAYNNGGGIGIFDAGTGSKTHVIATTVAGNLTFQYQSNGILGAGMPILDSCIVSGNSSHLSLQDLYGSFAVHYSLIKTPGNATLTGSGNITGVDPQLGTLTVNGGPTLTMLPALTSPVLDAGDPAFNSGSDQRGLPRVVNSRADMGAVERQYPEDVIFRSGFDSS